MYFKIGYVLATLVGIATFIGAYIYCIATYGFLFGLGLGWLPSAIVAVFAYCVTIPLWGLVPVAVLLLGSFSHLFDGWGAWGWVLLLPLLPLLMFIETSLDGEDKKGAAPVGEPGAAKVGD